MPQPALVGITLNVFSYSVIIGANAYGWMNYDTAAALATSVSIIGLAGIGLITKAIRDIGPALIELQKQREQINKGSLTEQIAALQGSLDAGNTKLHEMSEAAEKVRAAHAAELGRHQAEAQRLTRQLEITTDQLKLVNTQYEATRLENVRLMAQLQAVHVRVTAVEGQVESNQAQIVELKQDGGPTEHPAGST